MRVHPSDRALDVTGTIHVPASVDARDELRVSLVQQITDWNVEVVAPMISAGPALMERVTGLKQRVEGERGSASWTVRPRRPIPAGEPVTLRFSFRESGQPALLYYVGPEVAFASGWGDAWYPMVEGIGGVGTGDLTVDVPPGWKVFAGTAPRSTAEDEARGTYRFAQTLPTYFTFSAGPYTVVRGEGATPITAWLLTQRSNITAFLDGVSSMLNVLSNEFGPYVFDELSLVDVPRPIAKAAGFNAFSPAGFIVLNSRSMDQPDVTHQFEWLGHEMSHQWFPHSVTWDPPGFLYLEEALAEYGGMRVVEALGGPDAARRARTTGFEFDPIYSAAAYFRLVGAGVDQPLSAMTPGIDQRNLAYNKGFLVFDMLAREMGREHFRRLMRGLTNGRQFQTITWNQFRDAVAAESGRNLDWFFEQWLDRAGAPDFRVTWKQEGASIRGTITQPAPYYRATLKVEARGASGQRATRLVGIAGSSAEFDLPVGFPVQQLELDPDYEMLRWTPEFHALVDSVRAAPRRP